MTDKKAERGFTLLEVMVAVALIAVALTTLLVSQSQSVSLANDAKFETMAVLLAQGKINELLTVEAAGLSGDSGDFGEEYPGYAWEAVVSDFVIEGEEGFSKYLKQVDLTVTWGVYTYSLRHFHYTAGGG